MQSLSCERPGACTLCSRLAGSRRRLHRSAHRPLTAPPRPRADLFSEIFDLDIAENTPVYFGAPPPRVTPRDPHTVSCIRGAGLALQASRRGERGRCAARRAPTPLLPASTRSAAAGRRAAPPAAPLARPLPSSLPTAARPDGARAAAAGVTIISALLITLATTTRCKRLRTRCPPAPPCCPDAAPQPARPAARAAVMSPVSSARC